MTRKEYWYKFILYILIVLLFLGDIASVISKFAWKILKEKPLFLFLSIA